MTAPCTGLVCVLLLLLGLAQTADPWVDGDHTPVHRYTVRGVSLEVLQIRGLY